ncbi:MAG: protein-disulfide reductase DsbD domain-containing protein [Saprospiraceae bacterium]
MKPFTLLVIFHLLVINSTVAQQKLNPVQWTAKVKAINTTTFDIVFTAQLDAGWFLYSQTQERNDGPIPTTFIFQKDKNYERNGLVKESWKNKIKEQDPVFDMVVVKYKTAAEFTQRIVVTERKEVLVMIEYMTCRATSCLPERYVEFSIDLNKVNQVIVPQKLID